MIRPLVMIPLLNVAVTLNVVAPLKVINPVKTMFDAGLSGNSIRLRPMSHPVQLQDGPAGRHWREDRQILDDRFVNYHDRRDDAEPAAVDGNLNRHRGRGLGNQHEADALTPMMVLMSIVTVCPGGNGDVSDEGTQGVLGNQDRLFLH